ncbi:hypothetical protein DSO57_1000316 [Entomophthora muscae]|uniref:Uncharacterized protein n=1 Tax=Entomophthora muscae TaxID=34485 RepID=A0ACC2TL95_9FUNG|nr:hypothetical protein DSO57_1000316 [Entomophthora muscae]
MAVALEVSKQPLIPWTSYLSFFCLRQVHQALGDFLMLFQAAAAKVSLPKLAKLAALKVALNSTDADLPPWSEPVASLQDLISRLQNFNSNHSEHASSLIAGDLTTTQPLPAQIEGYTSNVSILNSPSGSTPNSLNDNPKSKNSTLLNSGDKTTTKYELKQIQDSLTLSIPSALCVIDTTYPTPHACKTSPAYGNNFNCCALLLNLFTLNILSLLTIEGHGESPSNFSDDSLFDYQYSPSSNCANMVRVDCNDPVLPESSSWSNILGALSLSPNSRIEDLMAIFDANPPGFEATKSSTPSMISSDLINKELSGYFLLLVSFLSYASTSVVHTLVDTGAKVNFISIGLAEKLGLNLIQEGLVKGGNYTTFCSLNVSKPLVFSVGNHTFTKRFYAVKNLVYLVILGIGWWKRYNFASHLKSNLLLLILPAGVSFSLPLLDALLCEDDSSLALCDQMVPPSNPTPLPVCITHLAKMFDPTRADNCQSILNLTSSFASQWTW